MTTAVYETCIILIGKVFDCISTKYHRKETKNSSAQFNQPKIKFHPLKSYPRKWSEASRSAGENKVLSLFFSNPYILNWEVFLLLCGISSWNRSLYRKTQFWCGPKCGWKYLFLSRKSNFNGPPKLAESICFCYICRS